jgi:soluble lytic murein transglycosylase-like protein
VSYLYHAGRAGIKVERREGAAVSSGFEHVRNAHRALALAGALAVPAMALGRGVYSYVDQDGVIRVFDEASEEYARLTRAKGTRGRVQGRIISTPQLHRVEIDERVTPTTAAHRWSRSGKDYDPHVRQAAARYELPEALIKAVMAAESAFNPRAVSRRGAQGLMQLMPQTSRELNVAEPFDPAQNIDGGARYLRQLWTQYQGDLYQTLAAYNAGPDAVRRARGQVPRIAETQEYVRRVLALYQAYIGG